MVEHKPMQPLVILFRGLNVGTRHRVAMADLRHLLASIGCEDVATYIQSGNVVCRTETPPGDLPDVIEPAFADRFGFASAVMVRTAEEMTAISAEHPLGRTEDDPRLLMVAFLDGAPGSAAALQDRDLAPDEWLLRGAEVYLRYPDGSGRSKLSNNLLESDLGVRSTVRNWNTVLRLNEMVLG